MPNQRQKPAKWTQLFATGLIISRSIDFLGLCAIFFIKLFTNTVFLVFTFWVPPVIVFGYVINLIITGLQMVFIFQELFDVKSR